MRVILLMLLFCCVSIPSVSQIPSGLTFHDAWTVPYEENDPHEYPIYGIMSNLTPKKDILLWAESPLGTPIVFETLRTAAQKKNLSPVETLDIPAEQVIFYDPGRTRLTLKNPVKTLKVGDAFPLSLTFRYAGTVKTTVDVRHCCKGTR